MNIILAIKPEFAEKTYKGEKLFEFRRRPAKEHVDRILLYESAPISAVTGEVRCVGKLTCPLEELWCKTKDFAGIEKNFFLSYFHGMETGNAYMLAKPVKYKAPIPLEKFGINHPPMDYMYLKKET